MLDADRWTAAAALASNDQAFRAHRGRTVPIPETLTSVSGYPEKLRIYRIAASRYWQVRCWFNGKTYAKSLRTTSKKNAITLAKRFFDATSAAVHMARDIGVESGSPGFSLMAEKLFQQESSRQHRGEFSKGSLQVMRNRLDAHILPELGGIPVRAVGYVALQAFADRLGREGFTTTTISQYLVIVRKILKLARHLGHISEVPEFPQIRVTATPRGGFSVTEYRQLLRKARALRGKRHPILRKLKEHERFWIARELLVMPQDIAWVIGFMVNTFVRPGDIKKMKHKHIEEVRGKHMYLRMNLPETKRHDKPVVSMRAAVRIYAQIQQRNERAGFGSPDDYLFLPQLSNREHALAVMNQLFHWVMDECGLSAGPLGQTRTLYSLRHTAITFRLLYGQGIDMLTLARNARTSVNMIERFYASALSGEMNVGMLHSRRQVAPA
jgi:hypothetical protein